MARQGLGHFVCVDQIPDRHLAHDGRHPVRRPHRLSEAAVAPLPQVDFPTIQVSATLPGADPTTMASSVAQPLETQFAQIPGVSQMTSTSLLSSTSITIQFDLDRNIDAAANDVQAAINAAGGQLPKNCRARPPIARSIRPTARSCCRRNLGNDAAEQKVDDQVETKIAQRISQIPGVAQVNIGGQQNLQSACRSIRRSSLPRGWRLKISGAR